MAQSYEVPENNQATDESWLEIVLDSINREPPVKILDRLADLKVFGDQAQHFLWTTARNGSPVSMYAMPFGGAGRNAYHTYFRVILNEEDRMNPSHVISKDYVLDIDSGEVGFCQSTILPERDMNTGPLVQCDGTNLNMFCGNQYREDLNAVLDYSVALQNTEITNLDCFLADTELFLRGSHAKPSNVHQISY